MAHRQMSVRRAVSALIGGLAVAAGGFALRAHFQVDAQLCNSGLGAVGQAFSGSVATNCTLVTTATDVASFMLLVAAILVLLGIVGLVSAHRSDGPPPNKPRRRRPDGRGLFG